MAVEIHALAVGEPSRELCQPNWTMDGERRPGNGSSLISARDQLKAVYRKPVAACTGPRRQGPGGG